MDPNEMIIIIDLMMEAMRTSETSVNSETTWRSIPDFCNIPSVKLYKNPFSRSCLILCCQTDRQGRF